MTQDEKKKLQRLVRDVGAAVTNLEGELYIHGLQRTDEAIELRQSLEGIRSLIQDAHTQ